MPESNVQEINRVAKPPRTKSVTKSMRTRLKSLKRFRRDAVVDRAERLESIIGGLMVDFQREWTSLSVAQSELETSSQQPPIDLANHPTQFTDSVESVGSQTSDESFDPEKSQEFQRVASLLKHARQEYQELLDFLESNHSSTIFQRPNNAQIGPLGDADLNLQNGFVSSASTGQPFAPGASPQPSDRPTLLPRPLSEDVPILHSQVEFLESESDRFFQLAEKKKNEYEQLREQLEVIRGQLLESRHETIELRLQNSDLTEELKRFRVPERFDSATLSWEERKEMLLKQFEMESYEDNNNAAAKGDIEAILAVTQKEIEDRDRQIEELKNLVCSQSNAVGSLAVGAAAVASVVESDELVQQEREKLRHLQQEWQEKMKQAEIEISTERAKIARDRSELQALL